MIESAMQSDLCNELIHHLHLYQCLLHYFLYGYNKASLNMFGHVNLAELPLA